MSLYKATKELVDSIRGMEEYICKSAWATIQSKLKPVEFELNYIERSGKLKNDKIELDKRRREIIEKEWEEADITHGYEDDEELEIQCNGWEHDGGNHFSRVYYISANVRESDEYHFSITFEDNTDKIISVNKD